MATSDDVPGLATDADSMDALVKKLRSLILELMELNGFGFIPGKAITP